MKVVLRNPRRELDVPAPGNVAPPPGRPRRRARGGARDPQRHAGDPRRAPPRRRRRRDPARSCPGGARDEVRPLPRSPPVIDVRRHNAGYCRDCFLRHCGEQVRRAIDDYDMIDPGERVLVAVSGGKDSLGLWQLLRELGYEADGLYVGLGIGEYSDDVGPTTRARSPTQRGWPLHEIDLARHYGFDIRERPRGREARAVLGVRAVEAARLQRRRARARLRRARDRPQPRRRGRGAARQRAALGDRVTSAASTRCCRPRPASCAR